MHPPNFTGIFSRLFNLALIVDVLVVFFTIVIFCSFCWFCYQLLPRTRSRSSLSTKLLATCFGSLNIRGAHTQQSVPLLCGWK
jgi:hypothetical protein